MLCRPPRSRVFANYPGLATWRGPLSVARRSELLRSSPGCASGVVAQGAFCTARSTSRTKSETGLCCTSRSGQIANRAQTLGIAKGPNWLRRCRISALSLEICVAPPWTLEAISRDSGPAIFSPSTRFWRGPRPAMGPPSAACCCPSSLGPVRRGIHDSELRLRHMSCASA